MITKFITPSPIISKTDKYFDESKIYEFIENEYSRYNEPENEEDKVKELFGDIFHLYNKYIENFSKKTENITVELSKTLLDRFEKEPGETYYDKLKYLLERSDEYSKLPYDEWYNENEIFETINYQIRRKMTWKKLYTEDKKTVLYEGFTLNNRPCGYGTVYHPDGYKFQEGLFWIKGLLQGKEYYSNGQVKFEGLLSLNSAYGPNIPRKGNYYDKDGNLLFSGDFKIRVSGLGYPFIIEPENFSGVACFFGGVHYLMWEDIRQHVED